MLHILFCVYMHEFEQNNEEILFHASIHTSLVYEFTAVTYSYIIHSSYIKIHEKLF